MTTMKQANNEQALRTNLFLAAIGFSVIAVLGGSYFVFGVVNGIPFTTMTAHIGDAFGVLVAIALLVAFAMGFPRIAKKLSRLLDQQAQIAALVVERNNAIAVAVAAETALTEAEEAHAQEMSEAHRVHAMSISAMDDKHVFTLRRLLRERREEKRQQFAAWHKGYKIVLGERDRALAQVESLQANQDRKLLTKADDLTALIIAAITGDLNRVAVRAVVPLSNGAYRKWSENLQAQMATVLATSVTAAGDPSAPPSSPTPQDTVVEETFAGEIPVETSNIPEGERSEGTAPETTTDESADHPSDEPAEVTA